MPHQHSQPEDHCRFESAFYTYVAVHRCIARWLILRSSNGRVSRASASSQSRQIPDRYRAGPSDASTIPCSRNAVAFAQAWPALIMYVADSTGKQPSCLPSSQPVAHVEQAQWQRTSGCNCCGERGTDRDAGCCGSGSSSSTPAPQRPPEPRQVCATGLTECLEAARHAAVRRDCMTHNSRAQHAAVTTGKSQHGK